MVFYKIVFKRNQQKGILPPYPQLHKIKYNIKSGLFNVRIVCQKSLKVFG